MTVPENLAASDIAPEAMRTLLLELAKNASETLVDLVLSLQEQNRLLREQVARLELRIQELEERLAKNSRNSNKPPGSEGLEKPPAPKSLRSKSGRKAGGQPGHPGHSLKQVAKPDVIVIHPMGVCSCGACEGLSLAAQPVLGYEKRQVFDLPPMRLEVTEHRAEIKRCPHSGREVRASFPAAAAAPVQYGTRFQGLMVYLNQQQLLPFQRLGLLCEDLFGQPLSLATLLRANQSAYVALSTFEARVIEQLQQAPLVHADESGLRVAGKLHWLHTVCTEQMTFYSVHASRGKEAMDAANILPQRVGWIIHDFWKPYFQYDCPHAVCDQHILRELRFFAEDKKEEWAASLMALLGEFNLLCTTQPVLEEAQIDECHRRYHGLLKAARVLHLRRAEGSKRTKQTKACNLLDRLEDYDQCVLAFLSDPEVPFTNNQAEQDIRMIKVKQKISGCFRTLEGAQVFARIRGFFSSARKQGRDLLHSITQALEGNAFVPKLVADT